MIIIRLENVSRELPNIEADLSPRRNYIQYYEETDGELHFKVEVKDGENLLVAAKRLLRHLANLPDCVTSPKADELP